MLAKLAPKPVGSAVAVAASSAADSHDASAGNIGLDEVGTSSNCIGDRGASGVSQGYGIIDLESQVAADGNIAGTGRKCASS